MHLLTAALSLSLALPLQAQEMRVVTGCGVRLRAEPEASSKERLRLVLGDEVQVLAQREGWLQVRLADGREGWVSAAFSQPLDTADPQAQVRRILKERLAKSEAPAGDWVEGLAYLGRLRTRFAGTALEPELDLAQLQFCSAFLGALEVGSRIKPQEHPALKEVRDQLVYSEPAGQWLVDPKAYWALHEKHKALPLADRLAFAASQAPLPGETEGQMGAVLGVVQLTGGRYLALHPKGAFVEPTLKGLSGYLGQFVPDPKGKSPGQWEPSEVPELKAELNKLRGLVQATGHASAPKVLELLDQLNAWIK